MPLMNWAQISINQTNTDPDSSTMLDIQSTDKGVLIPRLDNSQRDAIPNPATGLMIYNTEDSVFNYFSGDNWIALSSPWRQAGSNLYREEGNVGIGTSAPEDKLHLDGGNFLQTASNPVSIGSIQDNGTTALGDPSNIYIAGKYAYVTSEGEDGLEILNVSDPSNPIHVGSITDDATTALDGAFDVQVVGNYAYVISSVDDGLEILDISDPSQPIHVGAITDNAITALNNPRGLYIRGQYAYIASSTDDGVEILDISDPTNPRHVGAIFDDATTALDGAYDIFVVDKYAYVTAQYEDGVEILDISDPANPTHVAAIFDDANSAFDRPRGIYVSPPYAYVTGWNDDGVAILNISDPANPSHVGSIQDDLTTLLQAPENIQVAGHYAYVTSWVDDGMEVLDISDPTNPKHAGSLKDNGNTRLNGAWGLYVDGKYAYVTAISEQGIEILDITGIEAPAANFGSLASQQLQVMDQAQFSNNLQVGGGSQIGSGLSAQKDIATTGHFRMEKGAQSGYIPVSDSHGNLIWTDPTNIYTGDSLGNHMATQNIEMNSHWLSGDGDNEGIFLEETGKIGLNTNDPQTALEAIATAPEIRLTDERANSGNTTGQPLGRLSWYVSDDLSPNKYAPVAAIEVVAHDHTAVADGLMKFHVYKNADINNPVTPLQIHPDDRVLVTEFEFPDGSRQSTAPLTTDVLSLGAGAFRPRKGNHNLNFSAGFTNGNGGSFFGSGTNKIVAPVHLPDGAVITKVSVYGYDLHNTNIRTMLIHSPFQSSATTAISTQTSSVNTGNYSLSQNINHTLDLSQNHYYILVELIGGSWHSAGQLAINGVKIEYNLP